VSDIVVKVTTADFNGFSWDGFPFDSNPPALLILALLGKLKLRPDDRDYALFDVETTRDGVVIAEPGDEIHIDRSGISVRK